MREVVGVPVQDECRKAVSKTGEETLERARGVTSSVESEATGMRVLRGLQVKSSASKGVELQPRDFELMLFLNEMGPSEASLIGLRHFALSTAELTPARIRTTKERLAELTRDGYLAAHRLGRDGRHYFRTTPLGVKRLAVHFPDLKHLSAISNVALGTFDHHQRVAWVRVALEKSRAISGWRSERKLLSQDREEQRKRLYGKQPPYIPDAVYLDDATRDNAERRRVVLELELAAKTDAQMKRRVENLSGLLTYMPERYQGVHFVCSTEAIKARFERLSAPYGWRVETIEQLLTRCGVWGIYESNI